MTRRRGRPSLDTTHASAALTITLPTPELDVLHRQALAAHVTTAEVVRRKLALADTCLRALRAVPAVTDDR